MQCLPGETCNKTCASGDLACYVVDNNGFVLIADDPKHTGKFFGEVDGTILESLIQHNIFREIKIYDYQAICLLPENEESDASIILTVSRRTETELRCKQAGFTPFSSSSAVQAAGMALQLLDEPNCLGHHPLRGPLPLESGLDVRLSAAGPPRFCCVG